MRMRVWYLCCHETRLCCYLVIHIENLLRPLQLFYFHSSRIYWLSLAHYILNLGSQHPIAFRETLPSVGVGGQQKESASIWPSSFYLIFYVPSNGVCSIWVTLSEHRANTSGEPFRYAQARNIESCCCCFMNISEYPCIWATGNQYMGLRPRQFS
jgi:hypothetical protein